MSSSSSELARSARPSPGGSAQASTSCSPTSAKSNAEAAAEVLANAGFDVSTATVDVSSRESVHALVETATALGDVTGVIHAAGVSPSQATPEVILAVDLYGTALRPGRVREHHRAGRRPVSSSPRSPATASAP